ncbi:hypothetical protein GGF46_003381 [Coemansia sp. RSA 552]|nr:hypothetical protein GGF46_003381 [Coemansia sp. RSA 552]
MEELLTKLTGPSGFGNWSIIMESVLDEKGLADVVKHGRDAVDEEGKPIPHTSRRDDELARAIIMTWVAENLANRITRCPTAKELMQKLNTMCAQMARCEVLDAINTLHTLQYNGCIQSYMDQAGRITRIIRDANLSIKDFVTLTMLQRLPSDLHFAYKPIYDQYVEDGTVMDISSARDSIRLYEAIAKSHRDSSDPPSALDEPQASSSKPKGNAKNGRNHYCHICEKAGHSTFYCYHNDDPAAVEAREKRLANRKGKSSRMHR